MKRIKSKYHEEKSRKKSQRIIGVVLIFVMFGSVFGIVVNSFLDGGGSGVSIEYNGFEFVNENGLWNVVVGNSLFTFRYNPNQVEEIRGQVNFLNKYSGEPLYIYSENQIAASEISSNLGQFSEEIQFACLENSEEECSEETIKTCEDNFIIIKENIESKIMQEENCVFIQGPQSELVKITDEFLFKILGIR